MFRDLNKALSGVWKHPSLLAVVLLQLLFLFLVNVLLFTLTQSIDPTQAVPLLFALSTTLLLITITVFESGFFGMTKNVVVDGSTSLREFLPSVKRYWLSFLGYFFIILLITFLGQAAFMYVFFVIGPELSLWALIVGGILDLIIMFYFLLWMPAFIVFKDEGFVSSFMSSIRTSVRSWKKSLTTTLGVLFIFVLGAFIVYLLGMLTQIVLANELLWAALAIELLVYIIFCGTLVVVTLFVFARFATTILRKAHKKRRARKAHQ